MLLPTQRLETSYWELWASVSELEERSMYGANSNLDTLGIRFSAHSNIFLGNLVSEALGGHC